MRRTRHSIAAIGLASVALLAAGCSHHQQTPPATAGTSMPPGTASHHAAAHPPSHVAPSNVAMLPVTPEAMRQIQTELQRDGFYDGPIDGLYGPRTREAIATYQERHGLPKSAGLDWPTLQQLASAGGPGKAAGQTTGSSSPPASTGQPAQPEKSPP
jgi:peptidoglycan hydrolase-like protein with peptidoglycan-binding domain